MEVTISGWGKTEKDVLSDTLMEGVQKIVKTDATYGGKEVNKVIILQAMAHNRVTSYGGDSGGRI